jgi:hypothetical protein
MGRGIPGGPRQLALGSNWSLAPGSLGRHWTDLWRALFAKAAIDAQLAQASLIDCNHVVQIAIPIAEVHTKLAEPTREA